MAFLRDVGDALGPLFGAEVQKVDTVDFDSATLGPQQSKQVAEERRLARSVTAEHDDEVATAEGKVELVEDLALTVVAE